VSDSLPDLDALAKKRIALRYWLLGAGFVDAAKAMQWAEGYQALCTNSRANRGFVTSRSAAMPRRGPPSPAGGPSRA
jgi:hypothetical protein